LSQIPRGAYISGLRYRDGGRGFPDALAGGVPITFDVRGERDLKDGVSDLASDV
jgi:hypothetical protein